MLTPQDSTKTSGPLTSKVLQPTKFVASSKNLVGNVVQPTRTTANTGSSALTKPITADTEGAPKYNFSAPLESTQTVKKLFVSPDLDPSIQTPPTPAVNVAELKTTLLNAVATSLLCSPDFRNPKDPSHKSLVALGERLAHHDPEFILKLGIYTRLNLNIRTTANFLLALSAKLPACRPYLRKYYAATIKLPSDWIEVAEIYQAFHDDNIKSGAIPTALRKVMASKFSSFDTYQLAKYNKDATKKKKKQPTKAERDTKKTEAADKKRRADYKTDYPALKARQSVDSSDSDDEDSSVVLSDSENKEEIERLSFTLKQLIRKIHISEPVEYVMCLIGKKYPEDTESFRKSRLPGLWDQERAGKRMKLPTPETWETQVSTKGNKASTWESLIDHKKLPFMAMLRNIRNLIRVCQASPVGRPQAQR
jgi:telomerase protein component 1